MRTGRTGRYTAAVAAGWLITVFGVTAGAASWADKVHPRILDELAEGPTEFLVVLEEQAGLGHVEALRTRTERGRAVFEALTEVAGRSQAPLISRLERDGVPYRSYWIANMVHVRGDLDEVVKLAGRSDVRRLDANPRVRFEPLPRRPVDRNAAAAAGAISWGVSQIRADQVWALGYTGDGIVVAGQDTGYEWDHDALIHQYRGWDGDSANHDYAWRDAIHGGGGPCGHDSLEPCDDIDHGTHTMGVMVGDDQGSNRIGVAPGARWIGCRSLDNGIGTPATYSECFQFFLAPTDIAGNNPDPEMAPHVINNSWTCPAEEGCSLDTFETIVDTLRSAGIVVVTVATNLGDACSTIDQPPAFYGTTLTVGATDNDDNIAEFSARGPITVDGSNRLKPDVTAPGVDIRSSVTGGNNYATWSGTSFSGPHVVGMIALLLDARPDLAGQVSAIETIVKRSVVPRTSSQTCGGIPGSQIPNPVYGYGRVDALEAILGDADEDGVDNLNDCAPADGGAWAIPGDATALAFEGGPTTTLSWDAPAAAGGSAVRYDVLRSPAADGFESASCLASNISDTFATETDDPTTVFYYLVRAENDCGGVLGDDPEGAARSGTDCPDNP